MTSWREKQAQKQKVRELRREQIEQRKEEAAKKTRRSVARRTKKAEPTINQVVEDNKLLNRLLDQWEEREYGNKH